MVAREPDGPYAPTELTGPEMLGAKSPKGQQVTGLGTLSKHPGQNYI